MNKTEEHFFNCAVNNKRPYTDKEVKAFYNKKDKCSARYNNKIGDTAKLELIDMCIFPINICPKCESKNTFHRRMQDKKIEENVWRVEKTSGAIRQYRKFDFCLSCHSEFLIEFYIWKLKNK